MPRIARQSYNTCFFHVITQGINREYIFQKDKYIRAYLKLLKNYREEYHIKIMAYCIMNNHAHLLIRVKSISEMSQYMKMVNTKYARYYNAHENRVGYVFRNRYKSQPIYNETYLIKCIDYIHKNPVKANIVSTEQDYLYSSYRIYQEKGMLISKVANDKEEAIFIEAEDEEVIEPSRAIDNFEHKMGRTLEEIKENKQLFKLLVIELKQEARLSNRKIAQILERDKNTINHIVNSVKGT